MEKLTYTHNAAAAKVLAAFYETPPLAYVQCILTEPEIKNFGYGRIRVGGKPIRFL